LSVWTGMVLLFNLSELLNKSVVVYDLNVSPINQK
jgi:hypothetical protein